jgi:multiple sugar transport system substrate-binding protein
MTILDFSVNIHFLEGVRALRQMLDQFQQTHQCQVALHIIPGRSAWHTLIYYGLYGRGADVSEIGTTWVSGMAEINALRPFAAQEIADVGGEAAFLPSLWQPNLTGDGQVWSLPFLGDVRLIYYWRDMLSRTGTREEDAFTTIENTSETIRKLARVNLTPWATQTNADTRDIVYLASSWVWGAGGEFINADGKRTAFNGAAARRGLSAYFGLHRYMPQGLQPLNLQQLADLFAERRIAAMISGPWVMSYLMRNITDADLLGQVGVAQPPGPAFVGGPQIAIWRHTLDETTSLALVKHLLTSETQQVLPKLTGMIPVIRSVAESEAMAQVFPHYSQFLSSLQQGRNPANLPYWGLLEEYLANAFQQIWGELFENPKYNVDTVIDQVLSPMAEYLDRILTH